MSVIPAHVEAASTLAVISASNEPLLFLTADLKVIAASASFCGAFQIAPESLPGRALAEIGAGEWANPQLASLLKATASGMARVEAYEFDLIRKGKETHFLVLNASKIADGDQERTRLLLAITDVTTARSELRQKDALIREKAILLQEVQHRVANSLQIISSVLLQSARKVQSTEAKGYLQNAHHRVMSIAAVQRHLASASIDDVTLRVYFAQLCESLGASMIQDPKQISINVTVDDSIVKPDIAVSLGLIITELVINSLKHAFPEQRTGKISIDYHSEGPKWCLSVTDNGVGMPSAPKAKPGLGTGIVEALARQLGGTISVVDAQPGTDVTIISDEATLAEAELLPAA
jgi:two-component sensor histidine kinase